MDKLWSLLATTLIVFCLSAIFVQRKILRKNGGCSKNYRSSSSRVPLGSFGIWPFIGETTHFISSAYSERPETFTDKRRHMYGKVFKTHLFGSRTIVSTDAEVNIIILQSDTKIFVPSYPKSVMDLMGKSSILLINGSLQRRIHGLIGNYLKSSYLKAQITADMQRHVTKSMEKWGEEDCPVYIQDQAKNIAFEVLVKALTSLDCGDKMELLKKHFQEFIVGLMSLPLNLPGTQLYRSLQAKKKMIKLIGEIIKVKKDRNSYPIILAEDVLDALMNDTSEDVTHELIAENMIDLMIPGEDSVPVLVTLALKYLSDCPSALKQFTEENVRLKMLKEKLGEPFSWNDYLSLPFTQTVITETLRMGNIITGVMRKAMKDVEIKGHLIPQGWCVFAYFRSVHLDDEFYDSPYKFNPWRWQDLEMSNCNFTPFGGGQRLCPGLDLARLETSIFLHHFVTQFRWEAEDDTIINFPTVRMKRRMPVWVKRRVYS